MLDYLQSYVAKLSDFGLARLGPKDDESHVTTRVMGTYGYAAPEYVATGNSNSSPPFEFCISVKDYNSNYTYLWSIKYRTSFC